MVNYKKHPSYIAYLNGGTTPDERLLSRLATNADGRPFINPGELYCRYNVAPDQMCSLTAKFSSESALRNHYRKAHEVILEECRPGRLNRKTQDDMIRWYSALGAHLEHNWTPRNAKVLGRSPQQQVASSLLTITRHQCLSTDRIGQIQSITLIQGRLLRDKQSHMLFFTESEFYLEGVRSMVYLYRQGS